MDGWAEISALLLFDTEKLVVCWHTCAISGVQSPLVSFGGPALMAVTSPGTVWAPAVLNTLRFGGTKLNAGASLTGWIVIEKVCAADVSLPPLAVPPLSRAWIVTVADP